MMLGYDLCCHSSSPYRASIYSIDIDITQELGSTFCLQPTFSVKLWIFFIIAIDTINREISLTMPDKYHSAT